MCSSGMGFRQGVQPSEASVGDPGRVGKSCSIQCISVSSSIEDAGLGCGVSEIRGLRAPATQAAQRRSRANVSMLCPLAYGG